MSQVNAVTYTFYHTILISHQSLVKLCYCEHWAAQVLPLLHIPLQRIHDSLLSVQSVSAQCCWCSLHWVCCHHLPDRTPHNQLVLLMREQTRRPEHCWYQSCWQLLQWEYLQLKRRQENVFRSSYMYIILTSNCDISRTMCASLNNVISTTSYTSTTLNMYITSVCSS